MLHVGFGRFRRVMHRVLVMAVRQVRMMCCRFMTARFVVPGGFLVMMRCVLVMLCCLVMMLCRLL